MKKIEAIIRPGRLDATKRGLAEAGLHSLTVSNVSGRGSQPEKQEHWRGEDYVVDLFQKIKVEIVVHDDDADRAIDVIQETAHSGNKGDGKIFVLPVEDACQIRTNDRGIDAL